MIFLKNEKQKRRKTMKLACTMCGKKLSHVLIVSYFKVTSKAKLQKEKPGFLKSPKSQKQEYKGTYYECPYCGFSIAAVDILKWQESKQK